MSGTNVLLHEAHFKVFSRVMSYQNNDPKIATNQPQDTYWLKNSHQILFQLLFFTAQFKQQLHLTISREHL